MCVYKAITATILQMTPWHKDSAPVLKCSGYGLESWLAGHLEKDYNLILTFIQIATLTLTLHLEHMQILVNDFLQHDFLQISHDS